MLPDGYRLLPVDEDLLSKDHLLHLDDLVEEMLSERPSVKAFLDRSFAYCVAYDDNLVSWCLSEYNSGERCEIGIETQEDFQGRGLATVTASALIERAQSQGITQIGWHCFARNQASIAAAEKVGFGKAAEYPAYWALFDEVINLAVNGNACFHRQEFGEAVTWYSKAIEAGELPVWVYWNTACAYAHLGEKPNSFLYLNLALDKGFRDADFIKNSNHLKVWHGTREWEQIVQKLDTMS
jgi:GNAT superfamily N-acetyltransferase